MKKTKKSNIVLNNKEFDAFMKLVKTPSKATPELKKLMNMERLKERGV